MEAVALGLRDLGVVKGDRVGIWAPNCAEWMLVQYATAKLGAILVNINPAYRVHELEFVLNQAGIRTLVAAVAFKTSDYAAMIEQVRPACAALRDVLLIGTPEWDALVEAGRAGDPAVLVEIGRTLTADDPINIQYTSGTTGFPKGATLSHHNILNNGYFVGELCGYDEEDRICVPVPFYHCFGMVMGNLASTSHGACVVIPAPGVRPEGDAGGGRGRALHVTVRGPDDVHRGPERAGAGRARPLHPADRDHGRVAVPGRGDEAGHRPARDERGRDLLRHDGDVAGVDADPRGRLARPAGVHGRDRAAAPGDQGGRPGDGRDRPARGARRVLHPRLLGDARLLGAAGQDGRAIDAARWMHTGDLAVMDGDGYVNITGRIKDMVIRGGENIYPREIEEFLYTHPDIVDAQVIGVPDEKYGEELMAWVRLREGVPGLTAGELRAFCEGSWRTTRSRATCTSWTSSR